MKSKAYWEMDELNEFDKIVKTKETEKLENP